MYSKLASAAAFALAACSAFAQVVVPRGDLTDGAMQSSAITGGPSFGDCGEYSDPSTFHFWTFRANAGDVITIDVDRITGEFDPYMSLWSGSLTGSPLSDWTNALNSSIHTRLAFADDTDPPAVAGPYGDPRISGFVIPATGTYTVLISGACSAPGQVSYAYALDVQGSSVDGCARVVSRGDLTNGGTQSSAITAGSSFGGCGEYGDPSAFHFWTFLANAGDVITIDVDRITGEFDPCMSLWSGSLTGSPLSDWTNAAISSIHTRLAVADDTDPPAVPGPFGDPRISGFVVPATGTYTVLISGACSTPGQVSYAYALDVQGSSVGDGCRADFDGNGTVAVPDIFAFLSAWFAGCP